ncbi:MAG: ATP-binding protein [Anaerolineae bacterium]
MSIRLRLTLWNIAFLAAALIVFSVATYFLLARLAIQGMDEALRLRAENVADTIGLTRVGQLVIPAAETFAWDDTYVQILQPNGQIVTRSDNLRNRQLPIDDSMLLDNLHGQSRYVFTVVDGYPIRLYSAPVASPLGGRPLAIVQVARITTEINSTLRSLRFVLVFGILITLVLAAAVSAMIIRRGLRPITEITALADQIQRAEDTHRRIEYVGPNDEVGQLAATFNHMLERIQRAFAAQQRFLADASHALRTPLTAIQGNVELLLKGVPDPTEQRVALEAVRKETRRLSRVVGDLLLLAQADAGEGFQHAPVEMTTLVLEVYQQAKTLAGGVAITLGNVDVAMVAGDADRLKEVILNLVDNALKYTPDGGQVRVSLYGDPTWVRVEIADTGLGIAPEHQAQVFERFYRVPDARPRAGRPGGTGLGLPIAKWVVESHGGHITLASEPGKGSVFTVWLPAMPVEEEVPA